MKNIFKDLVDVAKYKRQRNTAVNNYETLKNKYTELLEDKTKKIDSIEEEIIKINNNQKKIIKRVSNLEKKRKR